MLLDANLEGLLFLLGSVPQASDTWTARAGRAVSRNLDLLRNPDGYRNAARYRRAVSDLNRLVERSGRPAARVSLADYLHGRLSPVRSADLVYAAEHPEENVFHAYFAPRLTGLVETTRPAVVGISLNYLSQALCTFAVLGFLRHRHPDLKLMLGGSLVTSWMSSPAWKNPFSGLVDEIVAGPGEGRLLALAGVQSDAHFFAPRFDGLPLDAYLAPGVVLPYSGSMGCYWGRCSFCPEKAEGAAFRPVPVKEAGGQISAVSSQYRPAFLHFVDNAISPALMKALTGHPPGTPWYGFSRFTDDLNDPDFCRALRASGCIMLKLGLESGDQHVLDSLGKGIDLRDAATALANLKDAGILTYVYLLFGTPAETLPSARKTLAFVVRHSASIDFLNLAIFNLPVNSPDTRNLNVRTFYAGDLSLYTDFEHPHGWGRRPVRTFLDNEFRRHPAVRPIILRNPPVFTSNHAPFFAPPDV
jgi:radical SAM superfamily enzyme YgiQ (UPF0313 family)